MTIQHASIPDGKRHEPKGVSTASAGQVYHADGAASGTWSKANSLTLQGLTGDAASNNKRVLSDGANGFRMVLDNAYGTMAVTNNSNGFAVTAAADSTLNTNTDYVLYTGTGAPWASENLFGGVTFTTDRLTLPVAGVYEIQAWANITTYPTNTAFVACKFRVNGTTFGPRKVKSKSNSAGDAGTISAFGLLTLAAGDFVQLYIASTASGSLVIGDFNTTIKLIRAL